MEAAAATERETSPEIFLKKDEYYFLQEGASDNKTATNNFRSEQTSPEIFLKKDEYYFLQEGASDNKTATNNFQSEQTSPEIFLKKDEYYFLQEGASDNKTATNNFRSEQTSPEIFLKKDEYYFLQEGASDNKTATNNFQCEQTSPEIFLKKDEYYFLQEGASDNKTATNNFQSEQTSPEIFLKKDEYYFSQEGASDNETASTSFQSEQEWISPSTDESSVDFRDVMAKVSACFEHVNNLQNAPVWVQPMVEQAAQIWNANIPFSSYYNTVPKEECELLPSNDNLQDSSSLINLNTEQQPWLDLIREPTVFDTGTASDKVPHVDPSGAFSGFDQVKSDRDSATASCYPDFSDMCSESYSFGKLLPTHTRTPIEARENLTRYSIPAPNYTINCNSSVTPTGEYYGYYSEKTPGTINSATDVNITVPSCSELFPQKTDVPCTAFPEQNQAETEIQPFPPFPITNRSHRTAGTALQSSLVQHNASGNSGIKYSHRAAVTPGRPLSISSENDFVGMPKISSEKFDESPVCILESVYSLHNNSHASFKKSSGTSDDKESKKESPSNKETNDGRSTEDVALRSKEFEISKGASLAGTSSLSSTLSKHIQSDKKVLLLLKERIPRATLNNKAHASAKLFVKTETSQPLPTQNMSTVTNSSRRDISNKMDCVSRSELQKCLPIHGSFHDREIPESAKSNSGNSDNAIFFDASSSIKENFSQKPNVSHKQFAISDTEKSHKKVIQWPSPQTTTATISTLQIQLRNSSQPKNLAEDKNLGCSTKTSSILHVGKGTEEKLCHVDTPPPYIAVVKKSAVNSSKKQRQKTVRELLAEKHRKFLLDSLARQTIQNSGQLNSPVRFITPLNEVSNNKRIGGSKRRSVTQTSTYTFNCDKQDCGKHFVRILPAPAGENLPLSGVQITPNTLVPASFQGISGMLSPSSCSMSSSASPASKRSKIPPQRVETFPKDKHQGILPPFRPGRVNAKDHRPRHYDIVCLQIGNFYVSGQETPSGRTVSKFKVIFTKRHFRYEFLIPDSFHWHNSLQSVACIIVTFDSVTAMVCDNNMIKLQVNCQPVTYLGSHQPRFGVVSSANVFDTSRPVDITNGEIMKCHVHEMQLRSHQADIVKKYLCSFDNRFKIITQRSVMSSESGSLELLPLPYVSMDTLASKKRRKKAVSGYVRRPPSIFDFPETTSQVCACRISCRSVRCSCVKAGQKCSQGRSICLCTNCDNPLNILQSMGISSDLAVFDSCLFHNIYQVSHLRQFLTREVVLSCCNTIRSIKECIPGVTSCPNSSCAKLIQFSWCTNTCYVIRENPPMHCALCGKCRFKNIRHCERCGKCYSTVENIQCPRCQPA